ncbi:MAG: hypothetical protein GX814_00235 [Microbacteriaceae bacterium]|nr:hypothetical protein [Microbacteriaceae bacterium]
MPGETASILEAVDIPSQRPRTAVTRVLVAGALVLLAVAALIAAGRWFYSNMLYQQMDRGHCLIISSGNCLSLSPERIEEVIGQPLPATVEVVESGSRFALKSGTEWVLLRSGVPGDLDGVAGDAVESGTYPTVPKSELSMVEVTGRFMQTPSSGGYTLFTYGTDAEGQALVYVTKEHDL